MRRAEFKDPFNGTPGVFFITTDHTETQVLFRNDEEYSYCVNSLAVCKVQHRVSILCYCVMTNHFHLLLFGRYEECFAYFDALIMRLSVWLGRGRGIRGLLKTDNVDIKAVTTEQQFKNAVAYILRNPYRARVASPFSYRWSSADVYFQPKREEGATLSSLPVLEVRRALGTKERMPAEYRIQNGLIVNRSFVDSARVEKMFGSSLAFFDLIRIYDLESTVRMSFGLAETVQFTDAEMTEKIRIVCRNEYHVDSPAQLDRKESLLLAKTMVKRYGAGKKQVARLTGLSLDVLDRLL